MPRQRRQVVERAGAQIVENRDAVALQNQAFGKMGADEARSASDKEFHVCILLS